KIRRELKESTSDFDREKFQERLAKLSGGVAVINVGAASEVELKDKKERVIDAVAATKAALEEGIVPGGAVALLDISQKMNSKELESLGASRDEVIGFELVKSAIESPFTKLMENGGLNPGELIAKARSASAKGQGFDILKTESTATAETIDMIKAGIIDPLKVVRTAVENAVSVATMVLTTEALVADLPEKNPPATPMGGGGMPGMGGMGY
ncbi:MAG: chaperonin GroEL, partial [Candidatus Roizmanbacteria bacterium]|nr:chaperonin GroEL [Candidatus Roizmanbacteria bacterium]